MKTLTLRAFSIGIVWAGITAAMPAVNTILYDIRQNEQTDWKKVREDSLAFAALGIIGYWRKHIAELKFPPDIAAALDMRDAEKEAAKPDGPAA